MKRLILSISLILCFLFFYLIGYYTPDLLDAKDEKNIPKAVKPISNDEDAMPTPLMVKKNNNNYKKNIGSFILLSSGAELFKELFQGDFLKNQGGFSKLESYFQKRFQKKYPTNEQAYQNEFVSRLGLLKAMGREYLIKNSYANKKELMDFYKNIALKKTEHFLVRRQALQNFSAWMKFLPEKDRLSILAKIPNRLLASAPKTEEEILKEIFHEEK